MNIHKKRLIAIGTSFGIGLLLMGVKFYAYDLTNSSAILSDALESIINVVAGAFAMGSVILAAKPPDETHPYGHGKIEFFSAGFEGALIIIAALGIFKSGMTHLVHPQPLPNLGAGLVLLVVAGIVNGALGFVLVRVGRRTDSLILEADGKHVLTDVLTTGGVLVGLLLVQVTGWYRLDGIIACLVGIQILITGSALVRQSFRGLMDAANLEVLEELSRLLVANRRACWVDIHQLRAWKSGDHIHIDLHLVLPRDLSLEEAHQEAKDLESLIVRHFQAKASALIHMDPCLDVDCPVCACHLCNTRETDAQTVVPWSLKTFTAQKSEDATTDDG